MPPSAAASLSAGQWAGHVRAAWVEVSPRLAVALSRRFPQVAAIGEELQRLVAHDAGEVVVQVRQGGRGAGCVVCVCVCVLWVGEGWAWGEVSLAAAAEVVGWSGRGGSICLAWP